jgi:hypothetical protein
MMIVMMMVVVVSREIFAVAERQEKREREKRSSQRVPSTTFPKRKVRRPRIKVCCHHHMHIIVGPNLHNRLKNLIRVLWN